MTPEPSWERMPGPSWDRTFWFRCPKCQNVGMIDGEQADGQVSIVCPTDGCGFHETGKVRPLVPSNEGVKVATAPTMEGHG